MMRSIRGTSTCGISWGRPRSPIEIRTLNLHRRHLTAPQLACVATDSLPFFEEEAKKRQFKGRPTEVTVKLPEDTKGEAREKAAEAVGVSARYVSDAKKIKEWVTRAKALNPSTFVLLLVVVAPQEV